MASQSTVSRRRLGAILVGRGLLTADQLRRAFELQASTGRRLGEIVVDEGWLSSIELALALSEQHNLPLVDLIAEEIDEKLAGVLPEHLARRYLAIPVREVDDRTVLVAVADPGDVHSMDALRLAMKRKVELAVADERDLGVAMRKLYRGDLEVADAEEEAAAGRQEREEILNPLTAIPAVKHVHNALGQCIEEGASDVHFEPEEDCLVVRARVDGMLREMATIPKRLQSAVISRLKIMASLDIAERRAPQDGRMFVKVDGNPVDLRVAVLPTTNGEQVVVRILRRATHGLALSELGMNAADEAAFLRTISQPHGAVIACGPTGSGKTTTLYTALQLLNHPARSLTTIEDPVEYQIPRVAQIEVRPKSGLTFAGGLRTILRSDPDVLLVGEIRDEETARIAIQAAMTGHLVLTSLHTQNAAGSIERLKDMGIEPGLLSAALNCIIAQRLARRLCLECRRPHTPTTDDLEEMEIVDGPAPALFEPGGCARCANTGYRGRAALYEIMPIEGRLRSLLRASTEEIFAAAVEGGMRTLKQDGHRLALEGVTSLSEIRRVTGDRLT
ncbi:MAG: GspE/PulE family protein [Gaiellaceae bacterium]